MGKKDKQICKSIVTLPLSLINAEWIVLKIHHIDTGSPHPGNYMQSGVQEDVMMNSR